MNNLLIAIAVFVITVVGALFAVPYFVDWNSYRSNFEEEASRVVGREVQVNGEVKLHLLPTPYFKLEKVRIADASPDITFFKADSLSIRLSIAPMLRGIVEVNEIEFQRPFVRLALDQKGAWNWQSLAKTLASAGYMPSSVTLQSLRITNGVLALYGPEGIERAKLEGINGELSAPALEGPYRFRGVFASGGAERELRLATATPDTDGGVRMRASMRFADSGATYLIDARAADLMGMPRLEGDITARVPIAGLLQPLPQGTAVKRKPAVGEDELNVDKSIAAFELKSPIKADASGVELQELSLTFEQDGRPQIITGSMRANWRKQLALDLTLASRWLDLDRISAAGESASPIEGIAKFSARLRDLMPGEGTARATLTIDQANFGQETIGPVRLSMMGSEEKLEIQEFRVGLPGGTRGELQGTLSGPAKAVVFDGNLGLRGTSIARLVSWASGNSVPINPRGDGQFGVLAQLSVAGGKAAAREIVGNLSGSALRGSAHYQWEGRPELAVALEGPKIDARAFVPAGSSLADVFGFLLGGADAKQDEGRARLAAKPAWRGAQPDMRLRMHAGQLITSARVYSDAVAQIEVKGGQLVNLQLRLLGGDFSLELQGSSSADAAGRAKGGLRGVATADTPDGVAPLMEILGVPAALRPAVERSPSLAPLRLAGTVAFGSRTPASADLVVDGEANGAAIRLNAQFDGGLAGWRSGKADITASADATDGGKIVGLVLGGTAPTGAGSGNVLFKATGVPAEGLSAFASLDAGGVALSFRGRVAATETGTTTAGELEFRARDGARLTALAGLSPPLQWDGLPINGRLKLSQGDGTLKLEKLALNVAGSRLGGQLAVQRQGDRRRIDASLEADEASVAALLAPLLDQRLAIAGQAEAAIAGRQAWPDEPFSATALDAFEGNIRLSCKRLILAGSIALEGAKLGVVLGGGKVVVDEISGNGLGGQFKVKVEIAKAPAGVELRGSLKFNGLMEAFVAGSTPRTSGPVTGVLDFTGRGLSPRSLMSTLQGQAKLQFGDAKLDTLWPGAIPLAADAGLKADPDRLAPVVRQRLASGLSSGSISLEQRTLPAEISDGLVRVKSISLDIPEGRVTGSASLDLRGLTFDSQWRLEAKSLARAGKPLPAVTVYYRGPLATLGAIEPRIDSAALEQELSARRIEQDVEELERLRRLDEQRRQQEAERLRKQFEATPPVQRPPSPSGAPFEPTVRPAAPG